MNIKILKRLFTYLKGASVLAVLSVVIGALYGAATVAIPFIFFCRHFHAIFQTETFACASTLPMASTAFHASYAFHRIITHNPRKCNKNPRARREHIFPCSHIFRKISRRI